MFHRIGSCRLIDYRVLKNVVNQKVVVIPKKIFRTSFHLYNNNVNLPNFSTCSGSYNLKTADNSISSLTCTVNSSLLSNPYVRLARMDRPIGNLF